MEFPDLSPYQYLSAPIPMLSIGWLGWQRGIQGAGRSAMTELDFENIRTASSRVVSLTLGFHECEFCNADSSVRGNGEFHYYVATGEVYSAPELILHYVSVHGYRLPEEFRVGLSSTEKLAWDDRAERLCELLADGSLDPDLRSFAVADIAHWRDPRAFRALLHAVHDSEFVDLAGQEIGISLAAYLSCDFASELKFAALPAVVRYGLQLTDSAGRRI